MTKHFFSSILLFLFIQKNSAQIDTSFWFVAPRVPTAIGVNSISLQIGAYSQTVSVRVRQPANISGVNSTFTMAANTSTIIDLTAFQGVITSTLANGVDNKGLYISSTDLISANYVIFSNSGQESISLKGANASGDDFYIPLPNNINSLNTGNTVGNVGYEIVATEPGVTTLLITPRGNLIGPRQKDITFVTLLNQGETFSCREGLKNDNVPRAIVAKDFNNDLIPDMAIIDHQYNRLFVFTNNGTGQFTEVANYSLGINATHVTADDVNADLNQDLIITNAGSNTVFVYLGNGSGSFSGPTSFTTGNIPTSVACADVNADSNKDLVITDNGSNDIMILTGNGSGAFATYTTLAVGTQPTDVKVGDFNNDGIPDLAVTNGGSNNVSILMGTVTAGSFVAAVNYVVGTNPVAMTLTDINNDGNTDIATANWGSNNASVLRGTSSGTFVAAVNFATGTNPVSIVSTSINAGVRPDLAVANYGSNNVSILLASGAATATAITFNAAVNSNVGLNPYSIAFADFNADGQRDFVTANFSSSNYSTLFGTGAAVPAPIISTVYGSSKPTLPTLLAGSIVSADKNVAVTISGAVMSTSLCPAFYADQITNSGKVGKDYVINMGNQSGDITYVLATVNSTSLNINTSTPSNWLINSGETYSVNTASSNLSYISSDKPIYVLNLSGNGCKLSGAQLAQAYCAGSYTAGFERMSADSLFLQIYTRSGYQSTFTLDVNSTSYPISASDFTIVPGTSSNLVSARLYYNTTDMPLGAYCILKNTADIFGMSVQNGSSSNGTQFSHLTNFGISSFVYANPVTTATICSNTQFTLNGVVGGGPITGEWATNGLGTISGGINTLTNNIYIPNPVDTNITPVNIILKSTGICPNKSDTLKLTVKQGPIVSAGLGQEVCSNNPTVQLSGQVYGASSQGVWNVVAPGNGTFVPGVNTFTPTYLLSNSDTALFQLKFVLTSTNNAGCDPVWDTVRLIINKAPIVIASPVKPLLKCTNNPTVFLNGIVSGTTTSSGKWETDGTGIFFPDNLSLICNYLPSQADLQAGSIYLTLESTNNNYCRPVRDSVQVIFGQPSLPNAGVDINSCKNNAVATLSATISGTNTTTGIWLGGSGVYVPSNTALTNTYYASPAEVAAGFVVLTFSTTNNGICFGEDDRLKITFQDKPTANFTVNTVCLNGVSLFTDRSLNTSGIGALTGWSWDLGDGTTTNSVEPIHTYSMAGTYTAVLVVKNTFNCYDTVQRNVIVHGLPTASLEISRACNGSAQLITFTDRSTIASPDNIPVNGGYYWDFGGEGFSTSKDTSIIFPSEGIYGVTHIVTSNNNCKSVLTQSVNITPKPKARFKILNNASLGLGANISFIDSSNIAPSSWLWDLGNGTASSVKDPATTYTANGTYTVSLTIADQFGCTDTYTTTVTIKTIASEIKQLIPNMITPNGDGKNDVWRLDFIDVFFPKADIEIYSRWGERIFKSLGYSNAWDGSYKGDPLPVGAYFYVIKLNNPENEVYKGSITLLK